MLRLTFPDALQALLQQVTSQCSAVLRDQPPAIAHRQCDELDNVIPRTFNSYDFISELSVGWLVSDC